MPSTGLHLTTAAQFHRLLTGLADTTHTKPAIAGNGSRRSTKSRPEASWVHCKSFSN